MSQQHTPGPWAIYGGVQNEGEFIIHKGATDIAVTRWALGDCNANARLIAAAPELLEACQTLATLLDAGDWFATGRLAVKQARAAIAKATGVEP